MKTFLICWIIVLYVCMVGAVIDYIKNQKEIKTLNAALSYSDSYIWKHCRYNFVSKEDFEEWKLCRREIAESQKGN